MRIHDGFPQRRRRNLTTPKAPTLITPPKGNSAFLVGRGTGTQGLPTSTGASTPSWFVNNARPEATLFHSFFGRDFQVSNAQNGQVLTPNPE
jgi:hypothetical protein